MPASLGRHKWLRLLLAAVGLYIVLLPFWWYTLDALAFVTGHAASFIYGFFDPNVSITPRDNTISVEVVATAESMFGGEKHSSALRLGTVTYGLPMLLALVLVTRADSLRARLRAIATGVLVMMMLTIPAILIWARMTSQQLYDQIQRETYLGGNSEAAGFFYYSFHGYAFSQPVVAVLIWVGMILLGLFKERPKREVRVARVARNAQCPCGSGRKYKRCCGRAEAA
ncbi:MAG TPA: SEC-C domain-containing protein [Blastocatellia bacterium]|nr:SEC-C domain-containing protein [Blastocatellia bacterium]